MPKKALKPEKIVEKEVIAYAQEVGWYVAVVDSKAVFSKALGIYKTGMAKKGFPDIIGVDGNGYCVAVELKAPGKLHTVRPEQRVFLDEVSNRGGFAIATDSVQKLHDAYLYFLERKRLAK